MAMNAIRKDARWTVGLWIAQMRTKKRGFCYQIPFFCAIIKRIVEINGDNHRRNDVKI